MYGPRVPAIVVSPYSTPGDVTNVIHDHTSILATIEAKWNLPACTYRDANAATVEDFLDLSRPRLIDPPQLAAPGSLVPGELGCSTADASQLIAAGFPTAHGDPAFLESCGAPKIFIQSTHDEFAPVPQMETLFEQIAEPKRLIWIEAKDHFFQDSLDRLEETVFGLKATA